MSVTPSLTVIDFDPVSKGYSASKILSLYNTSNNPVDITNINISSVDFNTNAVPFTIAAYDWVQITFVYTANTDQSATITISNNAGPDVIIDAIAVILEPIVSIDPGILNFGDVVIGELLTLSMTVSNIATNGSILNITNIQALLNPDITISQTSFEVVSGESIVVAVTFTPTTVEQLIAAQLTFTANILIDPIVCSGAGIEPIISLFLNSIPSKFETKVGQKIEQKVELKNTGNVVITVSNINFSLPFSVNESYPFSINPGNIYTLGIFFQPTDDALVDQDIVVQSNSLNDLSIHVTGQGIYPQILVDTSDINFGNQPTNIESKHILSIQNINSVDLIVSIQLISDVFVISPISAIVLANNFYNFDVIFKPLDTVSYTAKLRITCDDPINSQIIITITGTGVHKPIIEVEDKILFADTNVKTSSQRTVTINNIGNDTLSVTNISVIDSASSSYSVAGFIPTTIAPGGSAFYSIIFAPSTSGDLLGKIRINSSDIDRPQVDVVLKGLGVVPEGAWESFDLQSMLPKSIISTADAIKNVIDPMKTILKLINSVLSVVKVLLVDTGSALKAILTALSKAIEQYVNDLAASGVYLLPVFPNINYNDPTVEAEPGFAKFLASVGGGSEAFKKRVTDSFDDIFDSKRPQFSESADVGAYIIAIDSGNLVDVINGIKSLQKIFTSIDWQPQVQEPKNVTAVSGSSKVIVRWELPEFITFSISGIFHKQNLIDLVSGFDIYRTQLQSNAIIAQQDYYDTDNKTIISNRGDVIDSQTKQKLKPIGSVKASEYKLRFSNFAVGWSKDVQPAMPLGYEYQDLSVENGTNYYYTIRTTMGSSSGSVLSNEVVGSSKLFAKPSIDSVIFERCANFACNIDKSQTTVIKKLSNVIVKSINRSGIAKQSSNFSVSTKIQINAGFQQVNTFTFTIDDMIDMRYISIRNLSETIRRMKSNDLNFNYDRFIDVETSKIDTNAPGYDRFITVLNDTKLTYGWDLLIARQNNKTILTISDISSIGYQNGDDIYVEYTIKAYSPACRKQNINFDEILCANGVNKQICEQYVNKRCVYDSGNACLNVGYTKLGTKCVPNRLFFDTVLCQDGTIGGEVQYYNKQYRNDPNYCLPTIGNSSGSCAGYTSIEEGVTGTYPNWMNMTAQSLFKPVEDFIKSLEAWVNSELDAIQKGSESVTQFIDLLTVKINTLADFIDQIEKIIDTIKTIFSPNAGFYILRIDVKTGGVERIKAQVKSAIGGPDSGQNGYTAGLVLLIGGPNVDKIQGFLNLFF